MTKDEIVDAINASPYKAYFAITGGGQTFLGDYMSRSGASNTVIGAIVPYSQYAFDKFVQHRVESYASERAACKLAVSSYNECLLAGVEPIYAIGIGVACSLAKNNERSGRVHKVHVAIHTHNSTGVYNCTLNQGYPRQKEEGYVAELILYALNLATVNLKGTAILSKFDKFHYVEVDGRAYSQLFTKPDTILFSPPVAEEHTVRVIYPGSWNPLHDGHRQIVEKAQQIMGAPVTLELSVSNADKGQLDYIDINNRVEAVTKEYPLALTNAPTFVQKATKFRQRFHPDKIIFVVGADTWARIWDPKYAGPPVDVSRAFREADVQFLVFGRNNIPIYQGYWSERFRIPSLEASAYDSSLSSTTLRQNV